MRIVAKALASMVLLSSTAANAETDTTARQRIDGYVDAHAATIRDSATKIWGYAEPGFKEVKSSGLLQANLKSAGFKVTAGAAGMPTAFVASYKTGPGPVIGILAEFDALPGLSQVAGLAAPKALPGGRAGHGCGHNLLGAGAVGAAVAISEWMASSGFKGEVRVYGAPAEEGGDGKAFMVREGLFSDVDAVIHWHPSDKTAVWNHGGLANIKTDFSFTGTSSHAAAAPEKGRSAVAGAEVMDVAVNFMRQFTPDGTRIHGIVVDGGKAPNVVPAKSKVSYYVRHPNVAVLKSLQERLIKAAQGAAVATETEVKWEIKGGVYPLLINNTLAQVAYEEILPQVHGLERSAEEVRFSADIQKAVGAKLVRPEASKVEPLDAGEPGKGSTDVGDVSYVVPTVGFFITSWPEGAPPHSWASTSASGDEFGLRGAVVAAKVMANMAVRLMSQPKILQQAKNELNGVRGDAFTYEPLLGSIQPNLNYAEHAMGE